MPYIKEEDRVPISRYLNDLIAILRIKTDKGKQSNGQVVYAIYRIIKEVYGEGRFEVKSNALKVLDAAGKEYYRRIMVPYEKEKIKENGDV